MHGGGIISLGGYFYQGIISRGPDMRTTVISLRFDSSKKKGVGWVSSEQGPLVGTGYHFFVHVKQLENPLPNDPSTLRT